jgi:hypothetical protein
MPDKDYAKIPLNAPYSGGSIGAFDGLSLKEKADYEFLTTTEKNKTFYYEKGGNVLFVPQDYYNFQPNVVIDTRTLAGVTEILK